MRCIFSTTAAMSLISRAEPSMSRRPAGIFPDSFSLATAPATSAGSLDAMIVLTTPPKRLYHSMSPLADESRSFITWARNVFRSSR